jgi:hypothetical protein
MRKGAIWLVACAVLVAGRAFADSTSVWNGNVRVGGIVEEEEGDRSLMQETFNIHEGLTITRLYLNGRFNDRTSLYFDGDNLTLDGRRANLDLRRTGVGRFKSRYDENDYLFDPSGSILATRRDWWSTLTLTPRKWLAISGDYGLQTRRGDRIGYPDSATSAASALGTAYDSDLNRWRLQVEGNHNSGIGGAFTYDGVTLSDGLDARNERDGTLFSANIRLPGFVFDRLTHVVRGSIGESKLPNSGVSYDIMTIQYTGVAQLWRPLRLKYRFYGSQVEDKAFDNQTNRWIHDVDAEYQWRAATLSGGYGWEAWDDDRSVTTYDNVRGALYLRHPRQKISGSVSYSTRNKADEEDKTLLRDTEYARGEAKIDTRLLKGLTIGGRVAERTREMPDVDSKAEGLAASAYGSYRYEHSGDGGVIGSTLTVDYRYADDDYHNPAGQYHVISQFVTGRIELELFERITGAAAVHFVDISEDMDIEKSILSFEVACAFFKRFDAKVKYNVYNYDDFLIADYSQNKGFYTANVVWMDVGYAFSTE